MSQKIKRTFKMAIVDKDFEKQGREFSAGMGPGVFEEREVTFNLTEEEYNSSLFLANLATRQREYLEEVFKVTIHEVK